MINNEVIHNGKTIQMSILQQHKNTLERIPKNKQRNEKTKTMQPMQTAIQHENNTSGMMKVVIKDVS